jgi:hypothetical protein
MLITMAEGDLIVGGLLVKSPRSEAFTVKPRLSWREVLEAVVGETVVGETVLGVVPLATPTVVPMIRASAVRKTSTGYSRPRRTTKPFMGASIAYTSRQQGGLPSSHREVGRSPR